MMKYFDDTNDVRLESFLCRFEPITNNQWLAHIHKEAEPEYLSFHLSLNDTDLLRRDFGGAPSIAIDLIELAIIVYAVDRAVKPDEMSHCKVKIVLPVRSPELLGQPEIHDRLADILYWYTGYEWHFDFIKRERLNRGSENQQLFNWRDPSNPLDVALWSGGLDCLAGLYNRAFENPDRQFILCGTGANFNVHSLQKQVVDQLPHHIANRVKLLQVRYWIETLSGRLPESARMRSRGFTFLLIGAVCAYLEGSHILQVYENGIGAINLRFRESETGLNHARSVHPLSLMHIANWLSQVFRVQFRLNNPYLFQTKAQMCQIIADKGNLAIAFHTETCDRKHHELEAKQCGHCSSCILRRHAFAVLGIQDQTPYVYDDSNWLYKSVPLENIEEGNHIPAVLYQVRNLYNHLTAPTPWYSLTSQYETLAADVVDQTATYYGLSEQEMREGLLQLFSQYVNEWHFLQNLP